MKSIAAFKVFFIVSLFFGFEQAIASWKDTNQVVCVLPSEIKYTKDSVEIHAVPNGDAPAYFSLGDPDRSKEFLQVLHQALRTGVPHCNTLSFFLQ